MEPNCVLQEYHLTRFAVECQKTDMEVERHSLKFNYDLKRHTENKYNFMCSLEVLCMELDAQDRVAGYSVIAGITGYFSLSTNLPEEKLATYAFQNSVMTLYGALRGIVASVTGNFREGKYLLPSVMPQDIAQSAVSTREEIREASEKQAKERVASAKRTKKANKSQEARSSP